MGILSMFKKNKKSSQPPASTHQQPPMFFTPGSFQQTPNNLFPPPLYNQGFFPQVPQVYNNGIRENYEHQNIHRGSNPSIHSYHSHPSHLDQMYFNNTGPHHDLPDSRRGSIHSNYSVHSSPGTIYVQPFESFYNPVPKDQTSRSYRTTPTAPEQQFQRSYSSRSRGGNRPVYEGGENINIAGEVIYDSGYVNL